MNDRPKRRPAKDPLDHEPGAVTKAREDAGLTRVQLARRIGIGASLMSEIEKGTRNATPARIEQLAAALGVPPDHLRRQDGKPGTRLAVVCAGCSELWDPDHECPSRQAA